MGLARELFADVCILAGFGAVLFGCFEAFPPLAWVVGGGGLGYFGWRVSHAS